MGCWGVASDENDHTWDEMPICGKKGADGSYGDDPSGENRLVNYKATKHSRYGGIWTRNCRFFFDAYANMSFVIVHQHVIHIPEITTSR